jgi:hypothetical protein
MKNTLHIAPICTLHLLALLILTSTLQMSVMSMTLPPLKYGVATASQINAASAKPNFTFFRKHVRGPIPATKFIWQ